ncbi:2-C-methyl-D-erythritol 4-phosphate cytidylyltransferase [Ehrlichia ruminantium]|uniref:IspD/TarI family cytidylyltransferase n=1 Tax=Ehrlichia ruminantium TaxID=779 RepID=UPI00004C76DE|nr:IspD/TarI family cytidylyltransferase [Ehrlichia ruminantium]KYW92289.1 2-C-methyl-D-erythritol 4-phosphate cytidylyltransferase [Ehrlichia ruminantium]QLK50181.1 2-C-methyl-D-erythritol 4-phosphate cytidylyltransferase [Ehrlichia ruminantium]QLK51106.1 2-C-methyl-D-erythritol 4-phosphate cytidylyltransferase [Ehrlichia ruminantium]QLK52939.1 2-C-methyl-D-erythritol 4-phosphate cytidylyltransferase [Ehrlichia ruminantium]QLK58441.1 2-C-methyl-D-erythritol 4-phosphate cytidylyltransferase [E
MYQFVLLIVAAGNSKRFKGSEKPKQYMELGHYPILYHTINNVITTPYIGSVKVVIRQEHEYLYNSCIKKIHSSKLLPFSYGGTRRQDSVRIGLESIKYLNPDFVIIHDACRPFISTTLLDKMLPQLTNYVGVIPVLSITETIHMINENHTIIKNINRNTLKLVQTPQIYRYTDILSSHMLSYTTDPTKEFPDESSLMIHYNFPIATIEGSNYNLKITTNDDLHIATLLYKSMNTKVPNHTLN